VSAAGCGYAAERIEALSHRSITHMIGHLDNAGSVEE
jgi:hypothetical protein